MNEMQKKRPLSVIAALLRDEQVRRVERDGRIWYAAEDLVRVLQAGEGAERWEELKEDQPALEALSESCEADGAETDVLPLEGVLRLVQAIRSPKADRFKLAVAQAATERIEEEDDPERAILRTRGAYAARGHGRRWIDQRLRSVSGRHEIAGEWYRRGARDSDDFRLLTNRLMEATLGMDVAAYRAHRGLLNRGANLRDLMSDLELALLSLAETITVLRHREHDSHGMEQLLADVSEAGKIVSGTAHRLGVGTASASAA